MENGKIGLEVITNEVRSILLADSEIKLIAEGRIYPLVSRGNKGDFILYAVDEYKEESNKMGVHLCKTCLLIKAVSTEYPNIQKMHDLIRNALCGTWEDPNMRINILDSTDDLDDGKYVKLILFNIEW